MSLQSRFVGCGEGESGEKNSCGDSLPLVKRTADAKLVRDLAKHRRASRSPSESFSPPSPGRLSTGLKTQGRCCPVRRLQGLIVSFVKCGRGIVAATV